MPKGLTGEFSFKLSHCQDENVQFFMEWTEKFDQGAFFVEHTPAKPGDRPHHATQMDMCIGMAGDIRNLLLPKADEVFPPCDSIGAEMDGSGLLRAKLRLAMEALDQRFYDLSWEEYMPMMLQARDALRGITLLLATNYFLNHLRG